MSVHRIRVFWFLLHEERKRQLKRMVRITVFMHKKRLLCLAAVFFVFEKILFACKLMGNIVYSLINCVNIAFIKA